MTDAVAFAAGTSTAAAIPSGYRVTWAAIRYPYEAVGYKVTWAQIRVPAVLGNVGAATGIGAADAIARAIAAAVWEASGTAVATATGLAEYGITTFQSYGTSDVQAIGASLAEAIANSGGIGSAYGINPILTLVPGARAKHGPKKLMRAIVNDPLDLEDLAELWGMFRKAA